MRRFRQQEGTVVARRHVRSDLFTLARLESRVDERGNRFEIWTRLNRSVHRAAGTAVNATVTAWMRV